MVKNILRNSVFSKNIFKRILRVTAYIPVGSEKQNNAVIIKTDYMNKRLCATKITRK